VVDRAAVDQVLIRMQRDPETALSVERAREVAIREGIKAIVGGDITSIGGGFVLSTRLVSAESGELLAAYRESAADTTAIIGAIDRLSKRLRERMGESLKSTRANEPLDRVTTTSLEALRMYSQAVRAIEQGQIDRGRRLLEEAVALDTTFAMAYRKLGVVSPGRAERVDALSKAYRYRDRLTDRERNLTLGTYYYDVTGEDDRAIAAYESLLEMHPNDTWALNNLSLIYSNHRNYADAERLLRRAIGIDSTGALYYGNLVTAQVALGKFDSAENTLNKYAEKIPGHPNFDFYAASLASARGQYAEAEERLAAILENNDGAFTRLGATIVRANLAFVRGQLAEGEALLERAKAESEAIGYEAGGLAFGVQSAAIDLLVRGATDPAIRKVESALVEYPLAEIPPLDRPYGFLAMVYAFSDDPERAREFMAEYEREVPSESRPRDDTSPMVTRGVLALAEGQPEEAARQFRRADREGCPICVLPLLGRAYEMAEQPDSVLAIYKRYVDTPWIERLASTDWYALPYVYERLGQLYHARGDVEEAAFYYSRFIELWEDADAELQPRVEAARRALRSLAPDRPLTS
jgi:tetratricopeptide (TPR) repeat protein